MEDYEKSGQMGGSVGAIVQLITGVGVAVLVLIFVGSLGGQTYNLVETDIEALTTTVTDQSFTASNSTAVTIYDDIVNSSLTFTRGGQTVRLSDFTCDYDAGSCLATNATLGGMTINASFTAGEQEVEQSIKNGIISSFDALEQTGNYLPLIVLAVVIALVLAIVLGMGGAASKGGQNTAL